MFAYFVSNAVKQTANYLYCKQEKQIHETTQTIYTNQHEVWFELFRINSCDFVDRTALVAANAALCDLGMRRESAAQLRLRVVDRVG
jgi:hypothetical protein